MPVAKSIGLTGNANTSPESAIAQGHNINCTDKFLVIICSLCVCLCMHAYESGGCMSVYLRMSVTSIG